MVKWEEKISNLNLLTQLEVIDQLQLEDNEKYNMMIINSMEDIRRWIIENVPGKTWQELLKAVQSKRIRKVRLNKA